jgi:Kef-type K+ transport system membrane component KefB
MAHALAIGASGRDHRPATECLIALSLCGSAVPIQTSGLLTVRAKQRAIALAVGVGVLVVIVIAVAGAHKSSSPGPHRPLVSAAIAVVLVLLLGAISLVVARRR